MYDIPVTQYDVQITYFSLCFFAFFSIAYLFCKTCVVKLNKKQWVYLLCVGIGLSCLYTVLKQYGDQLPQLIMYYSMPLLMTPLKKNKFMANLSVAFVATSLFQVSKIVSSAIVTTLLLGFGINQKIVFAHLANMIASFVFCVLFMKIRRFRKGIQFFQEEQYIGLGLCISGIIILTSSISLEHYYDFVVVYIIVALGGIIAGFGLYLWIRRSITAHYRERLQLKSEEHYKEVLEERDKEIEKLNQSNEYLAKIVHRDNHLMSALDSSVDAYFNSEDDKQKDDLLREIQTLAKERGELIAKEQFELKLLPTTGNHLIDGAINDLYIKATAHGIDFNLTVSATVDEIIGKYISQTDLQTLLSDHIKDAIIAVESRGEAGGKILVNLSMQNNNYCIDIYDNGVEFDTDTLSKLGLERVTTHADTGGSGIGFVTTFETLKKAYASLIITEFENKTPFTKSVSFCFDGENAFIIRSYRSRKLNAVIDRADLTVS